MMKTGFFVTALTAVIVVAGCETQHHSQAEHHPSAAAVDGSKYLLTNAPEAPLDVIKARGSVQQGDSVTVIGRIGGSVDPWISGLAAFTIVDTSLKACSDIPGDQCTKPWDYCCVTDQLPTATALVKIVDDKSQVVDVDARQLLQLKELNTVVVRGKAQRDDAGNLVVLASGLFVKE